MKPKLKPPVTKRLKPKCDVLLITLTVKFNLRRYTPVDIGYNYHVYIEIQQQGDPIGTAVGLSGGENVTIFDPTIARKASAAFSTALLAIPSAIVGGAPTQPATVGRCRLTLSDPRRNRLDLSVLRQKCDEPLSNFAFNFYLRCYTTEISAVARAYDIAVAAGDTVYFFVQVRDQNGIELNMAGEALKVGRCRLTLSNPR